MGSPFVCQAIPSPENKPETSYGHGDSITLGGEARDFLLLYGLYDDTLSVEQLQKRFERFQGVTFGVAPKKEWPKLFQSLLHYEHSLACDQNDIGLCKNFTFDLELNDRVPEIPRAIPYPPEERKWIAQEAKNLCEKGVW